MSGSYRRSDHPGVSNHINSIPAAVGLLLQGLAGSKWVSVGRGGSKVWV